MKGLWKKLTLSALSLLCGTSLLAGCGVQAAHTAVPETDLAAEYEGEVKDGEGNFLVPFDVAYPEAFESGQYPYDENTLLLKMDQGAGLSRELKSCGVTSLEKFSSTEAGDWYRASLKEGTSAEKAIKKVRSLHEVLVADFDYIYSTDAELDADSVTDGTDAAEAEDTNGEGFLDDLWELIKPNTQVSAQKYLTQSGIQKAWWKLWRETGSAGGDRSVTVAVIDTGVDYTHPDLVTNMWENRDEIPDNGIDDDGNGYVDDVHGANTIADNGGADGDEGDPMDDHGHGTHVAGIIAAANNKEGIVGVAYNVKIMAVKAGQSTGVFNQSDIAEAILYAYDMGADVINMSFGGSASSIAVQEALETAYTRSTLVASAGNEGKPNEATDNYRPYGEYMPNYPAALSYVIGVMSVDDNGRESSFTNWDAYAYNSVEYELYAPGEGILSTLPGGRYGKMSGTSMAAPVVSGAAALLRSYFTDRDMYPSRFISAQLSATSGDEAACFNPLKHTVGGMPHNLPMRLNVYDALTKMPQPDVTLYDWYLFDKSNGEEGNGEDGVADAGETIEIGAVLRNRWGMSENTVVSIDAGSGLGGSNSYVEIINGSADFGKVGTYSTKDMLIRDEQGVVTGAESPLVVKIADDCPNDTLIRLNVTITYGNGLDESDKKIYTSGATIEFWARNGVVKTGQITSDETWTKDNYYIIPSSLYIAEGVTVTVEAGTQIQFWSDDPDEPYADTYIAYLQVAGNFIVNGTEEEPVSLFPSEMMAEYEVKFFEDGNGCIELNYTKVTNANMDISKADHCFFTQNFVGSILTRVLTNSGDTQEMSVFYHWGSCIGNDTQTPYGAYTIDSASSSIFYRLGGTTGNNSIESPYPLGTFDGCAFVDCAIYYGVNNYGRNNANYVNCTFTGNYLINNNNVQPGTFTLPYHDENKFTGNVILNNFNKAPNYWLKITAPVSTDMNADKKDLSGNYWGTTNIEMIERQIVDFDDYATLGDIDVGEYLTTPPEATFPFVTDAYLLNSSGERVRTVGNETVTFVVEFNRDMDTSVPLRVRFGAAEPYAEYEIEGEYESARRWKGTYTLRTTIENGTQVINIENGRAAKDGWLILCESAGRFQFEIDTTSAQAMIMQPEPTETGISLTWQQDDYETLMGYNVYRSDSEDGLYTRLNDHVLPVGTNTFFDDTAEPGMVYWYTFTVVLSDMTESKPAGKVSVRAMDTMAPDIYHSPVRTAYTGSNLVVSATITDNLQIEEAKLYYRVAGGEWKWTAMTANNSRYSGIIPASAISLEGLEYYIEATDGISYTYGGSAENPFAVVVKVAVDKNDIGDVDGDGAITAKDAMMILQQANGLKILSEEEQLRANVNGDNSINETDALLVLQYVSGKISSFFSAE